MSESVEWTLNLKDLATGKLEKFNLKLQKADQLMGKVDKKAISTSSGFNMIGGGALAAVGSIGLFVATGRQLISGMVEQVSLFQKYNAVLSNTFGSQVAAGNSMAMILDLAKETPFSVNELTESYVKLANRGVVPTRNEIVALGDFAAATGKQFNELTEAVMDASNPERWKEFGVQTKRANGEVTLSFKNQSITVKDNANAVKGAIVQFGRMVGVQGNMEAQSKTLGGQISNLGDTWDQFLLGLGSGNSGAMYDTVRMLGLMIEKSAELLGVQPMNIRLLEDETDKLYGLRTALRDANTPEEERLKMIKKLKQEYPDLLKNISAEAVSIGQVTDAIDSEIESIKRRSVVEEYKNKVGQLTQKIAGREATARSFEIKFAKTLDQLIAENPELAPLKNQETGELMDILRRPVQGKGGGLTEELKKNPKLGMKFAGVRNLLGMGGGSAVYSQDLFKKMETLSYKRFEALNQPNGPFSESLTDLNNQLEELKNEMQYAQSLAGPGRKTSLSGLLGGGGKGMTDGNIDSSLSASAPKILNITMDAVMKGDIVFQNATDMPMVKATVRKEISNVLAEAVADAKILAPTR